MIVQGEEKEEEPAGAAAPAPDKKVGSIQGKYVPPSMRDGASKGRGESMMSNRRGK